MTGQALVVQADALRLPLPDESVDLVVTSPPYLALRAYDAGPGQLGSEPTPQAYLEALWQATRETARVLKPTGSIFVNLGDKYSGYTNGQGKGRDLGREERGIDMVPDGPVSAPTVYGVPNKSLLLLPERYRIGCVDHLGLIARAVIVWNKPNGLPESVTDRVRRSHEDWVHLTKQPRYYAAVDEIRTPTSDYSRPNGVTRATPNGQRPRAMADTVNPLGALPGSVWSIPSEPLRLPEHLGVSHYAAFPSELPRRIILGWSPPGVCVACGQGRWPVVESLRRVVDPGKAEKRLRAAEGAIKGTSAWSTLSDAKGEPSATILGYACACCPFTDHPGTGEPSGEHYSDRAGEGIQNGAYPKTGYSTELHARPKVGPWREYHLAGWQAPPTRPAVVVDVFGGTGTTAMVAKALGRIGVSIDLSFAYGRAARWRIRHDAGKAISRTWTERQGSLL